MTALDLKVYRFQIQLREPLKLKRQTHTFRQGVLLERDGRWAEASPLPGFSRDSIEDVIQALRGEQAITPALQFALDSLELPKAERSHVPFNGLLIGTPDQVVLDASQCTASNCPAVKIKVGRTGIIDEIEMIKRIREQMPARIRLRLDANQAWTFNEAVDFATATADLSLDYVEEPLRDSSRLEELHSETGIAYALDESLLEDIDLTEYPNASALICKPTLLGGRERLDRLSSLGKPMVFSASFESGVGICRIIQLASTYAPETAAGLDTLDWLSDDLLFESPIKKDGRFIISGEPRVDTSSLERVLL
ncbi:MAG: o-succinylbenzoate synthase [Planctomycetota bacterium]